MCKSFIQTERLTLQLRPWYFDPSDADVLRVCGEATVYRSYGISIVHIFLGFFYYEMEKYCYRTEATLYVRGEY